MSTVIDGKLTSAKVREQIREEVDKLKENGIKPSLTVIRVGEDPASKVYVRNKQKACAEVGIESELIHLPEETDEQELIRIVEECNQDPLTDGILVQLPLPAQIDEERVKSVIDPAKDVDGFHAVNMGRLITGEAGFVPCTPAGIIRLLDEYDIGIDGAHCVIVGRSQIVGKPLALLLLGRNATVTICHSRTRNLKEICKQADILISAAGQTGLITADHVKDQAVVIDVAMNRDENGKLCGDVKFDEVSKKAAAITPVPGGVGPMTVAMLLNNCLQSAKGRKAL